LTGTEFWKAIKKRWVDIGIKDLADFSRRCDLPYTTIQGWIQRGQYPPLDRAYIMTKILNLTLLELLTGQKETHTHGHPIVDEICNYMESLDEQTLANFHAVTQVFRAQHFGNQGGDTERRRKSC